MKFLKFRVIVLLLNLCVLNLYSIDSGKLELKKAIKNRNFDKIIKTIEKNPKVFSRKEYEKAIIDAANKNDEKMFKLFEPYVSRRVHREAYTILISKNAKVIYN